MLGIEIIIAYLLIYYQLFDIITLVIKVGDKNEYQENYRRNFTIF